ncbi:hypothetical protein MKX01_001772 [Papaver californicum]|nr:hypothetical protein MKX01_001772 [Papaver californicum]
MVSIQSCSGGSGLSCFGEVAILCDILSRLPIKSLMRFKLVCTDWQFLLVFPLHKARCVGAETRIMLFSGEEEDQNIISSSGDLLLSCRNIIDTDFCIPAGVEMLKPVNGLVCFEHDLYGSVLIYNPSTRQRTCWIKTNIEIEKVEYFTEMAKIDDSEQSKLWSRYYGFGFDPITSEHKVVCVNKITICTMSSANVVSYVQKEIICEVLTVGENRWRKIDEVPPYMVASSVYVNGYIYWLGYKKSSYTQSDVILGFNVGSEKFDRVIKIPYLMLDLWCFKKNKRVSTWLVSELVETDGRLTIVDREGDRWINLWIYNDDDDNGNSIVIVGDCNWTKQKIPMPYVWDGQGCLDLEHIAGTDILIVKDIPKPLELEFCFYYDREKKEYCRKQVEFIRSTKVSSSPYCSRCPNRGYVVTSFVQTLLPVHTKK